MDTPLFYLKKMISLLIISFFNLITLSSGSLISYTIVENSSLTLSGSSNINKFECATFDNFSNGNIFITKTNNKQTITFENASLKLKIKSFDCKNPLLNNDFYKTLNANKSPYIEVELLNATPISFEKTATSNQGKFKTNIAITLNGKCRFDEIIVSWQKNSDNTFRFVGTKQLLMSDFGIEAPVSALGLIRVNNEILIHFDLIIQAESKII